MSKSEQDWQAKEEQWQVHYPEEFKSYIDAYGHGLIHGLLYIFSPFSVHYTEMVRGLQQAYEVSKSDFPDLYPFSLHNGKGGLFPVASSSTGHQVYWLVGSDLKPEALIVFRPRSSQFTRYERSLLSLVTEWLNGSDEVFGTDWLENEPAFLGMSG